MGYMGFGLQKWIYSMKPRKPFRKHERAMGYDANDGKFLDFDPNEPSHMKKKKERRPKNINYIEDRINTQKEKLRIDSYFEKTRNVVLLILFIAILFFVIVKTSHYGNEMYENVKHFINIHF